MGSAFIAPAMLRPRVKAGVVIVVAKVPARARLDPLTATSASGEARIDLGSDGGSKSLVRYSVLAALDLLANFRVHAAPYAETPFERG